MHLRAPRARVALPRLRRKAGALVIRFLCWFVGIRLIRLSRGRRSHRCPCFICTVRVAHALALAIDPPSLADMKSQVAEGERLAAPQGHAN